MGREKDRLTLGVLQWWTEETKRRASSTFLDKFMDDAKRAQQGNHHDDFGERRVMPWLKTLSWFLQWEVDSKRTMAREEEQEGVSSSWDESLMESLFFLEIPHLSWRVNLHPSSLSFSLFFPPHLLESLVLLLLAPSVPFLHSFTWLQKDLRRALLLSESHPTFTSVLIFLHHHPPFLLLVSKLLQVDSWFVSRVCLPLILIQETWETVLTHCYIHCYIHCTSIDHFNLEFNYAK